MRVRWSAEGSDFKVGPPGPFAGGGGGTAFPEGENWAPTLSRAVNFHHCAVRTFSLPCFHCSMRQKKLSTVGTLARVRRYDAPNWWRSKNQSLLAFCAPEFAP